MPNFGTCFGRRRAAGIPSLEILGVLLEAEVHLSVPLCGSYGAWEQWLECACCCRWWTRPSTGGGDEGKEEADVRLAEPVMLHRAVGLLRRCLLKTSVSSQSDCC